MTLGRRLIAKTVLLIASIFVLSGTALWGLAGLRSDARIARDEYLELRMIQRVDVLLEDVHGRVRTKAMDLMAIERDLAAAITIIDEFLAFQTTQVDADPKHQEVERLGATASRAHLLAAIDYAHANAAAPSGANQVLTSVEATLAELELLARQMDALIARTHESSATKLRRSLYTLAFMSIVVVAGGVYFSINHYRSIMSPLRRLQSGVRSIASGRFAERVASSGDVELAALADDFNRMADELEGVYRGLEEKVHQKSRELVRSERLASVGFLAAGVAHEINNPLNIISGYAEMSLARLRQSLDADALAESRESLQIIRDEAFRCKEIVEKLLSLARMGDGARQPVSMSQACDEVAFMLKAVKAYRDRRIELAVEPDDSLEVLGNASELKQVLLNLAINGLSACRPDTGCVTIEACRENGAIVIRVKDNGRGMSPETIDRVFEPFFSGDRADGERGVGLGLSITHAIIDALGGSIRAESAGPDRGSTFTIRLPAANRLKRRGQAA